MGQKRNTSKAKLKCKNPCQNRIRSEPQRLIIGVHMHDMFKNRNTEIIVNVVGQNMSVLGAKIRS